jgi:hypothetical protein
LSASGGWVSSARAGHDFKRLDPPLQRRIVSALDRLTGDPPAGDVVKLTNTDEWRLRVADWRVRFGRDTATGWGRNSITQRKRKMGRPYIRAMLAARLPRSAS